MRSSTLSFRQTHQSNFLCLRQRHPTSNPITWLIFYRQSAAKGRLLHRRCELCGNRAHCHDSSGHVASRYTLDNGISFCLSARKNLNHGGVASGQKRVGGRRVDATTAKEMGSMICGFAMNHSSACLLCALVANIGNCKSNCRIAFRIRKSPPQIKLHAEH